MLIKLVQSPLIGAFSSLSELLYGFRVIIALKSLLSGGIFWFGLAIFVKTHLPLLPDFEFLLSIQGLGLSVQNCSNYSQFALQFRKQNLI